MKYHYIDQYLASANHKLTINLIGAGGTGSHVLTNLAMINHSLIALERQPLFVRVWDNDVVTEHNCGRQMFSPADVGENKAQVLVTRINRFYGTHWHSIGERYSGSYNQHNSNITISCVDTLESRKTIYDAFPENFSDRSGYDTPMYWMDIGNNQSSGQIILGTVRPVKQPNKRKSILPNFFQEFPDAVENFNQPSCSMMEALSIQDLFVNKIIATYATHMLWDLFKNYRIDYRGIYVNLDTMKTSKIMI